MSKQKNTYLITESVRVAFKTDANNLEEAIDAYYKKFGEVFTRDGIDVEDSHDISFYKADANEEFKPITEQEEPIK